MSHRLAVGSTVVLVLLASTAVFADFAQNVSDSLGFVLGAYTVKASQGDRQDRQESKQLTNALLATAAVTQGLKEVVHSERPDGSGDDSFPSMHVSLASAWATVASREHPKQKWMFDAYVGAMAWSRVDLDRHRQRDVLAGALIGAAIGKHYSAQHRGWVLGKMSW
jgi:hypothetical protein